MKTKRKVKKQTYPQPSGAPTLTAAEKKLQKGFMVRIKKEHPKAKKKGWLKDSVHEIQEPPKKYLNTAIGVFIKRKDGKIDFLHFPYMQALRKHKSEYKKKKKKVK